MEQNSRQHTSSRLAERFEALRPRLRAWARSFLGNDCDTDDALQDAFYRLWRREKGSEGEADGDGDNNYSHIDALSITAVRSAAIDLARRREVRRGEPIEYAEGALASADDSHDEIYADVKTLIDSRLDPRAREIMTLHDALGYDYDEIASRLGITEANARTILSRARRTIRDAYRSFHSKP